MGKPSLVNMALAISNESWLALAVKVLCSFFSILYGPAQIKSVPVYFRFASVKCSLSRGSTVFLVAESSEDLLPSLSVSTWEQHSKDRGYTVRRQHDIVQGPGADLLLKDLDPQIRAPFPIGGSLRECTPVAAEDDQPKQAQE